MSKRYDGLLGLRGIGATMIIAYHMYVLGGYSGAHAFFDRTVGIGGIFVQLFFMLSSFSLMCGYAEKMWNNDCDMENFYRNRFVKLMPVFYIALCLHLLLNFFAHVNEPIGSIIGTASFLYALMPSYQESIVMAGWALGIEIIFYLIFPAFLVFTKTKLRTVLALLGSILLYYAYVTYYGVGIEHAEINIIYQMIPFMLGAVLYHCISYLELMNKKQRKIFAFSCQLLLLLLFLGWGHFFSSMKIVYIAFFILILNQICYRDILADNWLVKALGKISYEMYLFHMVIYRGLYHMNVNQWLLEKFSSRVLCYIVFFLMEFSLTVSFSYIVSMIMKFVRQNIKDRKAS